MELKHYGIRGMKWKNRKKSKKVAGESGGSVVRKTGSNKYEMKVPMRSEGVDEKITIDDPTIRKRSRVEKETYYYVNPVTERHQEELVPEIQIYETGKAYVDRLIKELK